MADATTQFFEGLAQAGQHPALKRMNGTIRIDLDRGGRTEHWRLDVRRGVIGLSRGAGAADCVIVGKADVFDELAGGRANALASMISGRLSFKGDPGMLVRFQRLFPSPTGRKIRSSSRTVGRRRG
jgi:SCP-2 sterol transfer family